VSKFTECHTIGLKAMETAFAYGIQKVKCYKCTTVQDTA